ncbi:MFS transporter [Rhodobacter veldkampii DSM 11550]|uniref:MFS transporter n=1 Tax=Phaeovulum veldkampii DSM 11550 TaxID=1185920 RepID=A0A2T4JHV6_9RHOB|nr:MFS transporter [Phaeovulum veldkampii]MBK5947115.1 MFS transporter [Phaeovulum veldkampii DSM 11550]NCU19331.1 MFS transporter [Candidatus Falkowbacteria bacterium]PTE17476.1 MFS transporter [Phaeovulum veldkampii DSM 11550]TDQ60139.1 putative MFS family arabinose efflux permease [Phaeovulum veldkampii DSM 11550]
MTRTTLFTPVLIGGAIILMLGFAVRASFGVFQIPIATEFGWPRAEFSLAIAIQNLAWGIGQPIFGALAERFGDRRAIVAGALMYAAGLILSAYATSPLQHQLLEVLVGFGIAGTGFGVILAVVGRAASDKNRSLALGIATAAGSAGQVFGAPVAEALLAVFPWQTVFLIFAGVVLASLFALPMLRAPARASRAELEESMGTVLIRAFKDPSYTLIFLGFFSCGYQLAFITAHFPAMVTEMCGAIDPTGPLAALGISSTSALGAIAISLIGLANIAGTITAGWLGNRWSKKYLLAWIYAARTVVAAVFILLPITPLSVMLFSLAMGALWLATVPLTSGLVAHIYGLRYMGTLYGFVFLSHQIGSFLGVWLGGKLYDIYGDYTLVWWVGVGVGAFSAIVHLPVRERPLMARTA